MLALLSYRILAIILARKESMEKSEAINSAQTFLSSVIDESGRIFGDVDTTMKMRVGESVIVLRVMGEQRGPLIYDSNKDKIVSVLKSSGASSVRVIANRAKINPDDAQLVLDDMHDCGDVLRVVTGRMFKGQNVIKYSLPS